MTTSSPELRTPVLHEPRVAGADAGDPLASLAGGGSPRGLRRATAALEPARGVFRSHAHLVAEPVDRQLPGLRGPPDGTHADAKELRGRMACDQLVRHRAAWCAREQLPVKIS